MLNAEQTINHLTHILLEHLNELYNSNNLHNSDFIEGEKTAFVECLEIIQLYNHSSSIGLSFNIEDFFPL